MDRLWQNVKDATKSVTVVKTLKTLVALIVIVLITGAYGMSKALQTNKIELTKTRLINQMANIYNNAGNIERTEGFAGQSQDTGYEDGKVSKDGRFAIFDSPVMGVRAMFRDFRTKMNTHDADTAFPYRGHLAKMIYKYAPPTENNTELYYKYVKSQLKDDMVTEANLPVLIKAVIQYENTKEVADYYLSDPKILQEAFALSTMSFDSDVSYEKAKKLFKQK